MMRERRSLGPTLGEWSCVLAVGPFAPEIADHLSYRAEMYATVPVGATVVTDLFDVHEDPGELADLERILGFDAADVNTHALDPAKADLVLLFALSIDAERFVALRDAGFSFYFYGWRGPG